VALTPLGPENPEKRLLVNTLLARAAAESSTPPQPRVRARSGSHPSRPSLVRLGSLPLDPEQDLRFVQTRLALFGKVTFVISGAFLVMTVGLSGWQNPKPWFGHASHLGATLIGLAFWRIAASRRGLQPDALQVLDSVGSVSISALFALMGHHLYQPYGFYMGLLAVVHVNVARAVIVPSVTTRTLFIAAASFAGLVISRALMPLPDSLPHTALSRARFVLDALSWSLTAGAVAAVASRVIYGLQERALEMVQLGQYSLEEKIGEGGMGEIYRARHAMLRRPTAVKLLTGDASEDQLRRFEKEVQLTARLTHPNTISVFDYGRTPDGTFYYAMELLSGMTLEQLVERHGPQPPGRAIHLILQVCGALNEAHGVGLIHRDIKPANIYLTQRGGVSDVVKVLDFGLVREVRDDGSVTRSNINFVVGTPLYLSPEAILAPESIDARADIYGLGGVLYLLLTGTTPFSGRSVVEICGHQLHSPPTALSARAPLPVPEDLDRLVIACLAKDPRERPQSARELARALSRCGSAGSWSESQADAWWAEREPEELASPSRASQAASAGEGEELPLGKRTFCPAHLARRLGRRLSGEAP